MSESEKPQNEAHGPLEVVESTKRRGRPPKDSTLSPAQHEALDHDGDGKAGGSLPIAKLSDFQRASYVQAAMEAYSQQALIHRVDSFHRNWTFCIEVIKSHAHVVIRAERGPNVASRAMSTAMFTQQHAEAAIDDVDKETGR